MDLGALEKIHTASQTKALRLLTIRTTLVALVAWILFAADDNIKNREVAQLSSEIASQKCLSLDIGWTLQPSVSFICDASGKPGGRYGVAPPTPEQLALAADNQERLETLYDSIFNLRADLLGNRIAIDLRLAIWTLPLLVVIFELLIFIQTRRLIFTRSLYRYEGAIEEGGAKKVAVFEAVSKHPYQFHKFIHYFLLVTLSATAAIHVIRLFPEADLYTFFFAYLVLAVYLALYGRHVNASFDAKELQLTGAEPESFPKWKRAWASFDRPRILLPFGKALLFATLLLPMGCEACDGPSTEEPVVEPPPTQVITAEPVGASANDISESDELSSESLDSAPDRADAEVSIPPAPLAPQPNLPRAAGAESILAQFPPSSEDSEQGSEEPHLDESLHDETFRAILEEIFWEDWTTGLDIIIGAGHFLSPLSFAAGGVADDFAGDWLAFLLGNLARWMYILALSLALLAPLSCLAVVRRKWGERPTRFIGLYFSGLAFFLLLDLGYFTLPFYLEEELGWSIDGFFCLLFAIPFCLLFPRILASTLGRFYSWDRKDINILFYAPSLVVLALVQRTDHVLFGLPVYLLATYMLGRGYLAIARAREKTRLERLS